MFGYGIYDLSFSHVSFREMQEQQKRDNTVEIAFGRESSYNAATCLMIPKSSHTK